jgi:uncharacterized protein YegL
MRAAPFTLVLALAAVLHFGPSRLLAGEDGVALAIIYDTSGSMRETVRNNTGGFSPKYVIANRALLKIVDQIEAFATNSADAPRKVHVGLFTFANNDAKEVVKFGPFDAEALRHFARKFSEPNGNTPLGNSLKTAARCVLDSPLSRKHVLVITDGVNNGGPTPAEVIPSLNSRAEHDQTSLSIHFVAFDVDAHEFAKVKKLGATVVGAANETQLNNQLDFILQKQILLEREEPVKTK